MNNEAIEEMEERMEAMSDKELKAYSANLPFGLSRSRCKKCKVLVPSIQVVKMGLLTKHPNKLHPLHYFEGGRGPNRVRKQINAKDDLCAACYLYHTGTEGIDGVSLI
tara:strand:+ start:382 stop:705 length:324 start_codon:yes stop_codon:yes gene_type:complete